MNTTDKKDLVAALVKMLGDDAAPVSASEIVRDVLSFVDRKDQSTQAMLNRIMDMQAEQARNLNNMVARQEMTVQYLTKICVTVTHGTEVLHSVPPPPPPFMSSSEPRPGVDMSGDMPLPDVDVAETEVAPAIRLP